MAVRRSYPRLSLTSALREGIFPINEPEKSELLGLSTEDLERRIAALSS